MPNLLIQPARVPSVSQAARNALEMRNQKMAGEAAQVQMQGAKTRNLLAEKQLGSYEEDRETQSRLQGFQTEAKAISTALQAQNSEQATQIYKSLGGKSDMGISIAEDIGEVSIDYGDTEIKGPSDKVAELMEQVQQDPTWITDPQKSAQTKAWMAARGISFKQKDSDTPTNAMASFLQQNPNATPGEMAAFTKQLARAEAEGKAVGDTEKPLTKKEANNQIQKIEESIYKIESGQSVMDMVKDLPGFQSLLAEQEIDPNAPDAKQRIMDYYEDRLDELYTITGKKREKKKPQETQPADYVWDSETMTFKENQ